MAELNLGISGHQYFENPDWVYQSIESELDALAPLHGFTSLAIGADQLFARLLAKRAMPFTVIVPSAHYDETFNNQQDLDSYNELLAEAVSVTELKNPTPSEQAFYDAGKRIVDSSDILIAIWNGKPAKGLGGTADIVKYAQDVSKSVIHLNPDLKTISRYSGFNDA